VFVLGAYAATGVVTDNSTIRNQIAPMPGDAETGVLYYPVISYTLSDGEVRTFTGPRGRSEPQFAVGEDVGILVSENDPERVRLNTVLGVWGTPIVLAGLAAIFLVIGLAAPFGFGGMKRSDPTS